MASRTSPRRVYVLTLYVAGATPAALHAIEQVRSLDPAELDGDVTLHVVDLGQNVEAGAAQGVIATPTLVRELPLPVKLLVGRLMADQVLAGIRVDAGEDDTGDVPA